MRSDTRGLEVEVLIGGPNWYSHVAMRINGTVYSNGRYRTGIPDIDDQRDSYVSGQALQGPNILTTMAAGEYISRSNCPGCNLTGYVLDITPAQEQQIKAFYKSLKVGRGGQLETDYAFLGNNCADLSTEAIRAGLEWYEDPFISSILTSPAQLRLELELAPWLVEEKKTYGQE